MSDAWSGGSGTWFLEVDSNASGFAPIWQMANFKATGTENILQLGFWVSGQKFRLGCEDIGQGQVLLRIHDFKCWGVTLP